MKIKAIIFASNDDLKLNFTLKNFKKHNPDIPVLIFDNGNTDLKTIAEKYNYQYRKIQNIWHKKTRCGIGSFDYQWMEYMFEFGLKDDEYTHILFLETDVYTQKSIKIEPKYDMAGPLGFSNVKENELFHYFNLNKLGYAFNQMGGKLSFPHTGCGATIYKKGFFQKCYANLPLIKAAYDEKIEHCYMDLLMTYLAIISGCTIGRWEDSTNIWGEYRKNKKGIYKLHRTNWKASMIHKIKYKNKIKFIIDTLDSKLAIRVLVFRIYFYLKNKIKK